MAKKRRGGRASNKRQRAAKRAKAKRGLDSLVDRGRQDDNYRNQRAGIDSVIQDVSDAPQRFGKNKESRKDFILRNTRPDGSLNSAAQAMLALYDDDRSEYARDLNRFMKKSPENTRAYAERFPKTYATMTGIPKIIKNSVPGLGMASRVFEAAQGLRDKPGIKEGVDMFQDLVLDPTVNLYNTIAQGTPGKTNIKRTFNPKNVPTPGDGRLNFGQDNSPSANFDGGGPYIPDVSGYQGGVPEMLSEEEVNELVFDPTTQDQINAMRSFGATDVGGTLIPGQDPVLTNKGSEIVRQSGQDVDVDEEIGPMITFKQKPLINIGTDITEEDIQQETEEGTPEGMTPGPEAEAAVDEVVDSFVTRNYGGEDPNIFLNQGYTGSLLNPNIVTNTDENFDTGVDKYGFGTTPEARAALETLNSLYDGPFYNVLGGTAIGKAQGGIASFANGGYNYINGDTMNSQSLTASANIDDRIMKNLQYEKMAPGMMGYRNGGLTSLNNSDYNKLKSTYQYMGDF